MLLARLRAELILTPVGRHGWRHQEGRRAGGFRSQVLYAAAIHKSSNPEIHAKPLPKRLAGHGWQGGLPGGGHRHRRHHHRRGEVLKSAGPRSRLWRSNRMPPRSFPAGQGSAQAAGHRRGLRPAVLNTKIYDEIIRVKDDDALETARRMAKEEGLLIGISSARRHGQLCRWPTARKMPEIDRGHHPGFWRTVPFDGVVC